MGVLYNYSTPTLTLNFKAVDISAGYDHYVTFSRPLSEKKILELHGESLVVTEHAIECFLSQEETALMPKGKVLIQVNYLYNDGHNIRRIPSVKKEIMWDTNLKDEVIE